MDLIRSTTDFRLLGREIVGFPLLFDRDMCLSESAHSYLVYRLIQRGRIGSRKSWPVIGQHLYDYFGFLEANSLEWSDVVADGMYSSVAAYRDASIAAGNSNSTVNQRLRTITDFYVFARDKGWIGSLPFRLQEITVSRTAGFLSHVRGKDGSTKRADVLLKRHTKPIRFLVSSQIRLLLDAISNPTHKMMARIGLQVGLRREEIATFPLSYVFDPVARGRTEKQIRISLSPRDMALKGGKSRDVYMSRDLMRDLHHYAIHRRPELTLKSLGPSKNLFLTDRGEPWADDGRGFLKIITNIGLKIGFHVCPHMLRHTYATHTLYVLMQGKDRINPLVFLQQQLGHTSIETTMVYLHLVNALAENATLAYDDEVTQLSRGEPDA